MCVEPDSTETESTSATVTTSSSTATTTTTGLTSSETTSSDTTASETSTGTTVPVDPTGSSTTWDVTFTSGSSSSTTSDATTETTGPLVPFEVALPITEDRNDGAIYYTPMGKLVWAPSGETGAGDGFFGEYPDGEYYVAYFRFALPEEIDTNDLLAARLELTATEQVTFMWNDSHAARAWLQLSGDAPMVESGAAFPWELGGPPSVGVSLIGETVRWPEVGNLSWSPGIHTTPDLTPLLDELRAEVDGISSGDHIQFWFSIAEPTGVGGEVTYVDFASGEAGVPRLVLTFAP